MSRVKSKDTATEKKVRSITHKLGYRFRIHRKDLPGNPDIVFPSRAKVIFVNGCFWHGHTCARGKRVPKTNIQYWKEKINRNTYRDKKNQNTLERAGWKVLVIWECQIKDEALIEKKLRQFLES